jgi:hypothetical protein
MARRVKGGDGMKGSPLNTMDALQEALQQEEGRWRMVVGADARWPEWRLAPP